MFWRVAKRLRHPSKGYKVVKKKSNGYTHCRHMRSMHAWGRRGCPGIE